MATYGINVFALSDATTNVAGIIDQSLSGDQWNWNASSNPTLSLNSSATAVQASVTDTDNTPGTLDDHAGKTTTQALSADTVIGGVTYAAGSVIENEYEVNLTDDLGNTYRFVAISINDSIVGFTFEGGQPPENETLSYTSGNSFDNQSMVPCFAIGTQIAVETGSCRVENIRPGILVKTVDRGLQPVLWVGSRSLDQRDLRQNANLLPIRVHAGALGAGRPRTTLVLSPQHRVLLRSKIVERVSGAKEALVAVKHLCGAPGINVAHDISRMVYFHLLLKNHEIIYANNLEAESLFLGSQTFAALSSGAQREIEMMIGRDHVQATRAARILLKGAVGRDLAKRHSQQFKQLQQPSAGSGAALNLAQVF